MIVYSTWRRCSQTGLNYVKLCRNNIVYPKHIIKIIRDKAVLISFVLILKSLKILFFWRLYIYTGCIKKNEQIWNCSQRYIVWVLMTWNGRKKSEIQVFWIQEGAYFQTNLKWLAHKIWMLKSNFKLVVWKFVRCFIAVQNFKKFGRV